MQIFTFLFNSYFVKKMLPLITWVIFSNLITQRQTQFLHSSPKMKQNQDKNETFIGTKREANLQNLPPPGGLEKTIRDLLTSK